MNVGTAFEKKMRPRKKVRSRAAVVGLAATLAVTLGSGTAFASGQDYSAVGYYTVNAKNYFNQALIIAPQTPTLPESWAYVGADGNSVPANWARVKSRLWGSVSSSGTSPYLCAESPYYQNSSSMSAGQYIYSRVWDICPYDYVWATGITSGKRADGTWRDFNTFVTDRIYHD